MKGRRSGGPGVHAVLDDNELRDRMIQNVSSHGDWKKLRPSERFVPPEAEWERVQATSGIRDALREDPEMFEPTMISKPNESGISSLEYLAELSRGGMGVVYRAYQASLRREVAAKSVKPGETDEGVLSMFLAEAYITAMLDHPNIVPVYDLRTAIGGQGVLTMKLVEGDSWAEMLARRPLHGKPLWERRDFERHLEIWLQVCQAVAYAHGKGVCHRDIKPANVMVGRYGEVYVLDWGLAVDISEHPQPGMPAPHKSTVCHPSGTPAYMPRELAFGEGAKIGPWTDVYLLGATLYEILAGEPPHKGDDLIEVLMAASGGTQPMYPKGAPKELRRICHRALDPDPSKRYQTVGRFRGAVRAFLKHRQSTTISTAAQRRLEQCEEVLWMRPDDVLVDPERDQVYDGLRTAIAGFQHASLLWQRNKWADEGGRRARLAYLEAALAAGDLPLAESLADGLDLGGNATEELRDRLTQAQQRRANLAHELAPRDRRSASIRRTQKFVIYGLALLVLVLAVALGFALS